MILTRMKEYFIRACKIINYLTFCVYTQSVLKVKGIRYDNNIIKLLSNSFKIYFPCI